ncbi:MAG: hypothetical protein M1828_002994 [Chrysothrix sp. TS-e1954]|nr:MAG: hypothetical protein M1828_002994 [Chrysothrix sp. TS-e1954]
MDSSQSRKRKGEISRVSTSPTSSKTPRTKKSSAYGADFEQHLYDHGIIMKSRVPKPGNLNEINRKLAELRSSLSPSRFSDTAFEAFQAKNDEAQSESDIMSKVLPIVMGEADIPSSRNIQFNNLAPLTDGEITLDQPDYYEGSRPADLHLRVRKELGDYIVPSTNKSRPCLPNFFAEAKGPSGNAAVVKRQACHDGAMGARAIYKTRLYVDSTTALDNNAYTIASTYSGGSGGGFLTLYTTHPTASEDPERTVDYRMTQLNGWHMTGNPDSFRQGASALRNARDWAQEKRKGLITAANSKTVSPIDVATSEPSTEIEHSQSTTQPFQDSDTSTDELAADISFLSKPSFSARTRHCGRHR